MGRGKGGWEENENKRKCSGEMPAHLICLASDATAGALKIPL